MSQIKLKHSGGNGVIIAAPSSNPAADRTLLLPGDGDSTIDTLGRAGNILQVVQDSTTTAATNTTTTMADTNLSGTITPTSSSSKILVIIQQQMFFANNASGTGAGINILRGSTEIYNSPKNSVGSYGQFISGGGLSTLSHHYTKVLHILDSPNTTSATTYKTQFAMYEAGNNGSAIVQNASTPHNAKSFIFLMEVAA
tara:strand:+ start:103 stop:696 length:594 start_codon:yes stop_codon:yes gene_type:complete